MITKIVTTLDSTQQVKWRTEKNGWSTITFSQGSYRVSANVDSSQILRLQKKMLSLVLGRLVMLNESLGGWSISDTILNVKQGMFSYCKTFCFCEKGESFISRIIAAFQSLELALIDKNTIHSYNNFSVTLEWPSAFTVIKINILKVSSWKSTSYLYTLTLFCDRSTTPSPCLPALCFPTVLSYRDLTRFTNQKV